MKITIAILLIVLYTVTAVPGNCNGGSSGNGVLELDETTTLKFQRPAAPKLKTQKPGFISNPNHHVRSSPEAKPKKTFGGRPGLKGIKRGGNSSRAVKNLVGGPVKQAKKSVKVGGREVSQDEINKYRQGDASADKKAQEEVEKKAGAKSTTGGKFVFAELTPEQTDACLGEFFFCNVDCATTFGMQCKVAAKIYSVFVPRQQHVDICVADRVANPIPELKEKPEYRQECLLRPCECKRYESWFASEYGVGQFNEGMKMIQQQCQSWCTTGIKPPGVIDKDASTKAVVRNKSKLMTGFSKAFKWVGNFLSHAKYAIIAIKAVGKAVGKAAKFVGRAVGKAAKAVGKGAKKAVKAIGKVGKKIGAGVKKIGKRIGRFFRRGGKKVKAVAKKIGAGAKKVAKKIGTGAKKVGKAIGRVGRSVGRAFRRFFRRRW